MLTISNDQLPQTCLSYLAFRIAFKDTLERLSLADQMWSDPHECFGFLTEVPFLQAVPSHVQIDLLARTWAKHLATDPMEADLVDEAVIYAACESAAAIVERDPASVHRFLDGGPLDVTVPLDQFLATELRALHLNLASEGDFLLISQFEDMHPDEGAKLKAKFGLEQERLEPLFDVLGLWSISPEFLGNLAGLLTGREILSTVKILGVK
ncbi:hypothetical protein [Stratiformator vulcanicus]|uniref:Uncharacterized protein n=1 Tax=Stratiformator vulcanicus TaxID=2527980 RepID=A0A517QVV0_9PLAN|nr:hypothetical protein [Stratiformator vulcanicus]QDT35714.1 hypothetical protein Pan189_00670 [Stratiformator vulcanicus]